MYKFITSNNAAFAIFSPRVYAAVEFFNMLFLSFKYLYEGQRRVSLVQVEARSGFYERQLHRLSRARARALCQVRIATLH